ncbi:MAG: hypothetical protein ACOX8S_08935 [Christensenellales bacterium]|jgi:signal transduction histidine kinase
MLDFYMVNPEFCIALQILSAAGFAAQAALCVLHMLRRRWEGRLLPERLLEIFTLLLMSLMTYHLALVAHHSFGSIVVPLGGNIERWVLFGLLLLLGIVAFIKRKKAALLPAAGAFLILPIWEGGGAFTMLYACAVLLLTVRSAVCAFYWHRQIHSGLSALSIKEAVDSLPSGILFCEGDGHIVLLNQAMQRIAQQLTGKAIRSGDVFYKALLEGEVRGEKRYSADRSLVYELPGGGVWRFKLDEIQARSRKYYQIASADITEEWRLTRELTDKKQRLDRQKEDLLAMLEDLDELSYQEELVKRKGRVHDVLGQQIAMVQNLLRSKSPDIAKVADSIRSMEEELKKEGEELDASFEQIAQSFRSVDVELTLTGELPKGELGLLLLDIIRECSTNAVRHGFATAVEISCEQSDGGYLLTVKNNGGLPEIIREGGGIRGMRRRASAAGGWFKIVMQEGFKAMAWVKGEVL